MVKFCQAPFCEPFTTRKYNLTSERPDGSLTRALMITLSGVQGGSVMGLADACILEMFGGVVSGGIVGVSVGGGGGNVGVKVGSSVAVGVDVGGGDADGVGEDVGVGETV